MTKTTILAAAAALALLSAPAHASIYGGRGDTVAPNAPDSGRGGGTSGRYGSDNNRGSYDGSAGATGGATGGIGIGGGH